LHLGRLSPAQAGAPPGISAARPTVLRALHPGRAPATPHPGRTAATPQPGRTATPPALPQRPIPADNHSDCAATTPHPGRQLSRLRCRNAPSRPPFSTRTGACSRWCSTRTLGCPACRALHGRLSCAPPIPDALPPCNAPSRLRRLPANCHALPPRPTSLRCRAGPSRLS
jgi:hypothetical protein